MSNIKNDTQFYREAEWLLFAELVRNHIVDYTIPQYGDWPNDQLEQTWTADDCKKAVEKYLGRMGRNARGAVEAERDFLKMAHFICTMFYKMKESADGPKTQ